MNCGSMKRERERKKSDFIYRTKQRNLLAEQCTLYTVKY